METRLFEDDYIAGNPSLAGTGSLVVIGSRNRYGRAVLMSAFS